MAGVGAGIESKAPSIAALAKGKVLNIVKAMKTTAEIASPSKLFKREVGAYIGEGVLAGIDESMGDRKIMDLLDKDIGDAASKEQTRIKYGGVLNQKKLSEDIESEINGPGSRWTATLWVDEIVNRITSNYGSGFAKESLVPEMNDRTDKLLEETNSILREQTEILRDVQEDGLPVSPSLKFGGVVNESLKMVARS